MFIEQAYKCLHQGWRYLVGFLIVFFIGWQFIGAIPIVAVSFFKSSSISEFSEESLNSFIGLFEGELNLYLALMLLTFVGGLVALIMVVKFLHQQSITHLITAREKVDWKRIWFAFFTWGAFSVASTLIFVWLAPEELIWNFNLWPFLGLLLVTLLLLPLQTSFEELLFRGYLMQGIGIVAKNRWLPLLITSVVFGLLHIFNPEIAKLGYSVLSVYIALGFFFGIITLMDDGMELALGFHAANNMFIALLVTSDWTALQTNSIFIDKSEPDAMAQIIPIFIILPVLLFIYTKKYKWTDWKEKLTGKTMPKPLSSDNTIPEDLS